MNNIFNKEQLDAIESIGHGPILVLAGAGTGKTTVLTERINYLTNDLLFNENEILAITFTNKAAFEMKDRLIKKKINIEWIGTFHSIAMKMLRRDIHYLDKKEDFKIIDKEDSLKIIKEIYDINNFNIKEINPKNILSYIDDIKSKYICIGYDKQVLDDYLLNKTKKDLTLKINYDLFINVWKEYENKLNMSNYLDFNDILSYIVYILKNHNQVREYWKQKFQYILIDEFQDTNNIQYEFIKLISNQDNNIFAVGDGDQSIYSFRGANSEIINKFANEMKAKLIILKTNYRSTQQILDLSNSLIKKNKNRFSKELFSVSNDGDKPIFYLAWNQEIESKWIITQINKLISNGDEYKDFAILIRSNYLSRSIEQELVLSNIPYKIYGAIKFYQRAEVKDLIAYLSVIWNYDEVSIKRIINIPNRKIGDTTIQEIEKQSLKEKKNFYDTLLLNSEINISSIAHKSIDNFISLIEQIKNIPYKSINELIDLIIDKTGYLEYKEKKDPERIKIIKENIQELKNGIDSFEKQNINTTLGDYLQNISFFNENSDLNKDDNFVSVLTVHASKGLEFKNVFISSFNENIFPTSRSIEDGELSLEEERRVAYVALTRAKKNLFISCNSGQDYITKINKKPSRFIQEIGIEKLNVYKPQIKKQSNVSINWYDSTYKISNQSINNYNNSQENDYKIGDMIVHISFGVGIVLNIDNDVLEIEFKKPYGLKKIIYNHKSIKRKFA